jgi:hypothetical protein
MDLARVKRWLHRYGPAELTGIGTALLGSYVAHLVTGNEIAAAFGGSLGETLGFYGVIVAREIRADRAAARATATAYGPRAWLRTAANLMLEFGPAEILDTGLIRPFTMGVGTRLCGRALGVPLGKIAADVTFYLPVILMFEWRRRKVRAPE